MVNHSLHFVNPVSGIHTQTVESYWNRVKTKLKRVKGCAADQLPSYIDEFMWRETYGKTGTEALTNIIHCISTQYPVYMQPCIYQQPETPLCLLSLFTIATILKHEVYLTELPVCFFLACALACHDPYRGSKSNVMYVHAPTHRSCNVPRYNGRGRRTTPNR